MTAAGGALALVAFGLIGPLAAARSADPAAPVALAGRAASDLALAPVSAPAPALVLAAHARPLSVIRYVDDDPGCGGQTPCYGTIGAAEAAAEDGDVIRIASGAYEESVVTGKALRFEGPGAGGGGAARWSVPAGSPYALLVDARMADITDTHVSGLTFDGGPVGVYVSGRRPGSPLGPPPGRPGGGATTDVDAAAVIDSRFEGQSDAAIVLRWVGEARVEGITASGAGIDGVRVVDGGTFRLLGSVLSGAGAASGACVRLVETRPAAARTAGYALGDGAEGANDFTGCAAVAVALENRSGDPTPAADVAAPGNRWGRAWETEIETRILDALDLAAVGRVLWRPALDAPAAVDVAFDPDALVADGVSRADVAVAVADAAGQPVEDGVIVALDADAGRLEAPGARAEAEGSDVETSGTWAVSGGPELGDFEGDGYVRSDEVGATLSWTFEAPAVVARLGAQPLEEAIVQVEIDDRPPEVLALVGSEMRWVEHRLAAELGPGPHALTLTVAAGTVAVDALGAGWPTAGGEVRTEIVAPTALGLATVRADAWGASGRVGGSAALPLVPGPPSAMSVTVGASSLAAGGATTAVVVRANDALGRRVRDGTPVTIDATLGEVEPAEATFVDGAAEAVFTSGDALGDARITATADGVSGPISATAVLRILPGPPASIALDVDRESMTANSRDSARVSARVRDELGNPVQDGTPIVVETSLGTLEGFAGATAGGVISGLLRAGARAGIAELRVRDPGGAAPAASRDVRLLAADLWVTKQVEPVGVVVPGEIVTFTVAYGNRGPGSLYDVVIDELMPDGIVSTSLSTSGPALGVRDGPQYIFDIERLRPGAAGEIQVRGRIDPRRRWNRTTVVNTVRVEAPTAAEATPGDNAAETSLTVEPAAVYSVTLSAPAALPVGGATGVLAVRVFDRFGNDALDGTPVSFSTDLGAVEPALATTVRGRASATFTSGTTAGTAFVRALSLDDRGASTRIRIEPGPANDMSLVSSEPRLRVSEGRAELTAGIADQYGNPVSDTLVVFSTDLGTLSPGAAFTGADGVVTSTLVAGERAGTANVEARVGTLARGLRLPFDPGPPARLEFVPVGRPLELLRSTLVAARLSDAFDNPVAGVDVSFAFDLGGMTPSRATTNAGGLALSMARPVAAGRGRILALGAELDAALEVDVRRPIILLPYALQSTRR